MTNPSSPPMDRPESALVLSHPGASADEQLPSVGPHVVFRRVDGGAVLLSMTEEVYFGLNAVGARVWELLPPECATVESLCDRLSEEYPDADASRVRADVTELLAELVRQRLVIAPVVSEARA